MPHEPAPQWLGDDVTQCLSGAHVHTFLECIVGYWNSYFGLKNWTVPSQIPDERAEDSRAVIQKIKNAARIERIRQLSGLYGAKAFSGVLSVDSFVQLPEMKDSHSERSLLLAMVRRAVYEYSKGITSPLEADQREALNAYWWIMGYGWLLPRGADPYRIEIKKDRLHPDEDPFSAFSLSPVSLVKVYPEGAYPTYTGDLPDSAQKYLRLSSMVSVSCMADINYISIRNRLSAIPPPDDKDGLSGPPNKIKPKTPKASANSDAAFLESLESRVGIPLETYNDYYEIY
jgi:hypothetical protein